MQLCFLPDPQTISQCIAYGGQSTLIQNAIPAVAVAISMIALYVSLRSLRVQQIHNRKSVRPVGHIALSDSLQGLHVKLVNKGCGPMQIKEFTAEGQSKVEHNIKYHLPENILAGFTHQFHTEPEGYWLLPGEELTLLNLQGDHMDPAFVSTRESVRTVLSKLITNLTYCDIYDEKHPKHTKSLTWFSRSLI